MKEKTKPCLKNAADVVLRGNCLVFVKFFFPKECIVGFESTALLTVLYLNFGKSLKANEHALIFVIFRSLQG